jgi:hypothetical protein
VTPDEFRYDANKSTRWARALRLGLRVAFGVDPEPSDELVRAFAAMYYDADPLAEAFVEEAYFQRGDGRALLDRALDHGVSSIDAPPASLVAMLEDIERDPEWLDWDRVEHGARVFRRFGPAVFRFAGALTMNAYSESSVAKPLALTGGYAGDKARHRFMETVAFWIAVSEPGGLRPFAQGRASALRVRVMHVFVRKRLSKHPEWNLRAWGVPISQADAMLTLMGGSFAPGYALRVMGYRPTRADIEAMMHFWRYVGHLMGVRPAWYPETIEDAVKLSYITALKGAHLAGEDGSHLCRSWARAFEPAPDAPPIERLRARVSDGIQRGYARFFLPPWVWRKNQLPRAGLWALWPLLGFPIVPRAHRRRRGEAKATALVPRAHGRSASRVPARRELHAVTLIFVMCAARIDADHGRACVSSRARAPWFS